jgi:hypothetical protein
MICYGTPAIAAADIKESIGQAAEEASAAFRVLRALDQRPSVGSAVYYTDAPAPPNNCDPRLFEIVNPDPGEPRCVGVDLQ